MSTAFAAGVQTTRVARSLAGAAARSTLSVQIPASMRASPGTGFSHSVRSPADENARASPHTRGPQIDIVAALLPEPSGTDLAAGLSGARATGDSNYGG